MSALGTVASSTQGRFHWTHRMPERITFRGEAHYRAKLTADAVRQIRASTRTNVAEAKLWGVCHQHIRDIRQRRKWSWVR